jgi:predicted phage-related endonuclease
MSKNEITSMIEVMNNYDELAAKAKAKADAIREAIKEEMIRQGTEELTAGAYIIRYTSVISNRFDSTTFKRLYADLYKDFTKPVSSRRFSVSC